MFRWLVSLAIGACLAVLLARLLLAVLSLGAADYTEGPLLVMARRWAVEAPGAAWWEHVPFTATAYGPLYPFAWSRAILAWPSVDPLLLGRLMSVGATVVLAVVIIAAVRGSGAPWPPAAFAVAIFLASPVGQRWPATARVDPLCAALLAAAYWTLGSGGRRGPAIAVLLGVLATTAKQTAVFHLGAMVLWLLVARSPRAAVPVLAIAAAAGVAVWVPILTLAEGYFWQGGVIANLNRLSVWQGGTIAYAFLASPLAVAALLVAGNSLLGRGWSVLTDRWWVAFATSLLVGMVLCFKVGSDTNYFLDAAWCGAILLGRHALALAALHPGRTAVALGTVAALVTPPSLLWMAQRDWAPTQTGPREAVERLAAAHHGPVLADGLIVGFLPASRGTPLVNDPLILRFLGARAAAVNADLVAILDGREGEPLVLLTVPLEEHVARLRAGVSWWPDAVLRALERDFCLAGHDAGVDVYRRCDGAAP